MTPPLPPVRLGGVFCPGFFSEWPGFLPGIGSGWSVFRVSFVGWCCIHLWMYDPPSPFFWGRFRLPFGGRGRGFVWMAYFFVFLCIFLYFSLFSVSGMLGWIRLIWWGGVGIALRLRVPISLPLVLSGVSLSRSLLAVRV